MKRLIFSSLVAYIAGLITMIGIANIKHINTRKAQKTSMSHLYQVQKAINLFAADSKKNIPDAANITVTDFAEKSGIADLLELDLMDGWGNPCGFQPTIAHSLSGHTEAMGRPTSRDPEGFAPRRTRLG